MSDPILPLRVWDSGTNENSLPANDNSLRLEALSRPCLGVANDAAGGDAEGDVWIVGDTPTGAFAPFDEDDIAIFDGIGWHAWAPVGGLRTVVADARKVWDGSAWVDDPSVGGSGSVDWGSIGGSLADQTDLKSALDAKADAGVAVQTAASTATLTPTYSDDVAEVTAQAAALTIANPSGTAIDGHGLVIRIKDNGTARALSWGSDYRAIGVTLPTTTVVGKQHYIACIRNSAAGKMDVLAVGVEA